MTTTTETTGHSIIAGSEVTGRAGEFEAAAAATGSGLGHRYSLLDLDQLSEATAAAAEAFASYRATTPQQRADFLERCASEIEADSEAIISSAVAESGLPTARITGEVGRTTGQLRLFARVVRDGDHQGVRIDPALPDRSPLPRPDLRQRQVPLGPVVVFGASNFPLAFSTAGGDTASALAAGCPVIVKGHPAHPGAGYLVARAVARAVAASDLHPGVFGFVLGEGTEIGQRLVTDPRVKAVGFTGSRGGGLALVAAAAGRSEPIPVYAEMSSINPVIVLPSALRGSADEVASLAQAYVASLTQGSGQFCTNPGLLYLPAGDQGEQFLRAAEQAVAESVGQTMLTEGIASTYRESVDDLAETSGMERLAAGSEGDGPGAPAAVLTLAGEDVDPAGIEEIFGASGVVVRWSSLDALADHLSALEGQLTATVHLDADDDADLATARTLLPVLEDRVGRILFNGWPTGVEVCDAMVHGGPFPATSDARTTSVGSLAIERFQRPVCYQDIPAALAPTAVAEANEWGLVRRVDGHLELG